MSGLVPRRGDKALVVGKTHSHYFEIGDTVTALGHNRYTPNCQDFAHEDGSEQELILGDYILERDPLFAFLKGGCESNG